MNTPKFARCIKSFTDSHIHIEQDDVHPVICLDDGSMVVRLHDANNGWSSCNYTNEFFEPASEEDFDKSISLASQRLNEACGGTGELSGLIGDLQTNLLPSDSSDQTHLPAIPATAPGAIRNKAYGIKKRAGDLTLEIKKRSDALKAKINAKMQLAREAISDMGIVVGKLEYVVETVNLYLGAAEEIIPLKDGKPAPASTPISIRQKVLYMDEECALSVDESESPEGIDFEQIHLFDKWLLEKPEHLRQVLPEAKGVVVLQVRRHQKHDRNPRYPDELNKRSYWLIRNGDRLHRIFANVDVGDRLIPHENEVTGLFEDKHDQPPLRPGTREYMNAMETADKIKRHYMQLALVLQGLLDRTRLFAPFDGNQQPNLLNPHTWEGRVKFITDDENILIDGRPSFGEWLQATNGNIRKGLRIAGYFPTHGDYEHRLHPRTACRPSTEDTYTIEEHAGKLFIRFSREGDYRWTRHGQVNITRRASYLIYRTDAFYICIDNANIPDMEYYLKDRRHRQEYATMVPALKKAIAVKQAELEAEQPFKDLLLRKLNEIAACPPEIAAELIHWWKNKTNDQRPLLSDDQKAYKMIVSRFQRVFATKNGGHEKAMLDALGDLDTVLLVRKKDDRTYSVYRRIANDPIYVNEETWTIVRNQPRLKKTIELVLAQKRQISQVEIIHQHDDWAKRPEAPKRTEYLPVAMIPSIVPTIQSMKFSEGHRLFLIQRHDDEFRFVTIKTERGTTARREYERLIEEDNPHKPCYWIIHWNERFEFSYKRAWSYRESVHFNGNVKLLEPDETLYVNTDLLAEINQTLGILNKHNNKVSAFNEWCQESSNLATGALESHWEKTEHKKYIRDGGDQEFFTDHLKTLFKPEHGAHPIADLLKKALCAGHHPEKLAKISAMELRTMTEAGAHPCFEILESVGWKPAAWPLKKENK